MATIEKPRIEAVVNFAPQAAAPAIAQLTPAIVGPAYALTLKGLMGPYDPALGLTFNIASQEGLIFDNSYTKFYISNGQVVQLPQTIFDGVCVINGNQLTLQGLLPSIASGDTCLITNPVSGTGKFKVVSVAGNVITINSTLPYSNYSGTCAILIHEPQQTGLSFNIPPRADSVAFNTYSLTTYQVGSKTSYVDAGAPANPNAAYIKVTTMATPGLVGATSLPVYLKVVGTSGNFYITSHTAATASGTDSNIVGEVLIPYSNSLSGNVLADYRFLKAERKIFEVASEDDITANAGMIHPDNPLAFGLSMAFQNAQSTVFGISIKSNDNSGYNDAIELLEQYNTRIIAPLTNDRSTLLAYANFVKLMNSIERSNPRFLRATMQWLEKTTYADAIPGTVGATGFKSTQINFTDFITVNVGDTIEITSPASVAGEYTVTAAGSNQFTIDRDLGLAVNAPVVFNAKRNATKLEQKEYLKDNPYLDRNITVLLPPKFISASYGVLDSYFAAAGLAGLEASTPVQVQMNGLVIAGVDDLLYSNFYFLENDLSEIAGSGKLILIQDTPEGTPYIRNQLTTDVTSLLTRSMHINKSIAVFIITAKDILKDMLKRYNITPDVLALITVKLNGLIKNLVENRVAGAGGVLTGGRVVSVVRDETALNTVIATVELVFPAPLEKIRLVLNVSV